MCPPRVNPGQPRSMQISGGSAPGGTTHQKPCCRMAKTNPEPAMPENLSRREEMRGTRTLVVAGCCLAAVLFIAVIAWVALPKTTSVSDYVGRPASGADSNAPTSGVGTGVPA